MEKKLCSNCKYYRHTLFSRMFLGVYSKKCLHPKAVDYLDGEPEPCIMSRLYICGTVGRLYEKK